MSYREHATTAPGTVVWERTVEPGSERMMILPDGCMDLIWDGRRLFVAGPDSAARWHESAVGATYTGLRFSGGTGPALLGVRADELRDRSPDLDALWSTPAARHLSERVAALPAATLAAWAVERAGSARVDPFGNEILTMSADGMATSVMADHLGLSARQLHRRCVPLFGYGPRRLGRVLRLGRALDVARAGASLVEMAVRGGYADQAHLCREIGDLCGTTPTALLRHLGLR